MKKRQTRRHVILIRLLFCDSSYDNCIGICNNYLHCTCQDPCRLTHPLQICVSSSPSTCTVRRHSQWMVLAALAMCSMPTAWEVKWQKFLESGLNRVPDTHRSHGVTRQLFSRLCQRVPTCNTFSKTTDDTGEMCNKIFSFT